MEPVSIPVPVETTSGVSFDISDYITDPKAELEGVWRSLGRDKQNNVREVKIARAGNDLYNSLLRKKQRANQAVLDQQDDEAFRVAEQINKEVIANTVIRGLRVNGTEVAYTPDMGVALLKSRDFHGKINAMANQADAYKEGAEADTVKS